MAQASDSSMPFARDFGYLAKFFDGLTAHAGTLGAAEGARLKTLIGEERVRWEEIKGLVAGQPLAPASAASAPATSAKPSTVPVAAASAPASEASAPVKRPGTFTVGSLIGQPKR